MRNLQTAIQHVLYHYIHTHIAQYVHVVVLPSPSTDRFFFFRFSALTFVFPSIMTSPRVTPAIFTVMKETIEWRERKRERQVKNQ
jgi:hypothetical protein